MRSCSSVRHRAGGAGARHVPLTAPPWVLRANLELGPYPTVPSRSIRLPPPGRALHPRIQQGQRPQAPQGAMGWNAEGSPLLWEWRPTLPGQLPISCVFLAKPRSTSAHHVPCVCSSQSTSSCTGAGAADSHRHRIMAPNLQMRLKEVIQLVQGHLAKRAELGHSSGFNSMKEWRYPDHLPDASCPDPRSGNFLSGLRWDAPTRSIHVCPCAQGPSHAHQMD